MNVTPPDDNQKWLHEMMQRDAHREHDKLADYQQAINEAAMKGADAALRAVLLINGGAAVSVLAFIGGLAAQSRIKLEQLNMVANSLGWFAAGVATAVAGMGLAYLTNYIASMVEKSLEKSWQPPYARPGTRTPRLRRCKVAVHIVTVVIGLTSLALFVYGVLDVKDAISHLR
jgi:hypothetical protein